MKEPYHLGVIPLHKSGQEVFSKLAAHLFELKVDFRAKFNRDEVSGKIRESCTVTLMCESHENFQVIKSSCERIVFLL